MNSLHMGNMTLCFSNLFCVSECKFNEFEKSDLINKARDVLFCDEYTIHSSNLHAAWIHWKVGDWSAYLFKCKKYAYSVQMQCKTLLVNCKRIMEYSMDMGE